MDFARNGKTVTVTDSFELFVPVPEGNAIFDYAEGLENKYKINNSDIEAKENLTISDEKRVNDLRRYLSYYETIDDAYKSGIFYPISKQCDMSQCEIC